MKIIQHQVLPLALLLFTSCIPLLLQAQSTFPRNGVYDDREGHFAFIHASIHTSPQHSIQNATLLIKEGRIIAVGKNVPIPADAIQVDLKGKHIYPSLIDIYTSYGLPEAKKEESHRPWGQQQMVSNKDGAYSWNQALLPEFQAHLYFKADDDQAQAFRKLGFGAVAAHRMDGISRGSSVAVLLGADREHLLILKDKAAHHLSFKKGSSTQNYPGSLMGGIALLRQTYLDADWYKKYGHKEEYNISLDAWNQQMQLPQIFEVRNRLEILRADKIAKEFGLQYTYMGNGDEYQRLQEIKNTGASIILPLNFPKAYDVEDPFDALNVSLAQMKHWELAPSNPARLSDAGIPIIFTTHKLKNKSDLFKQLRKAISSGLSPENALKALTETPAKLLGIYDQVGSIEKGKRANFIITDAPLFEEKTKILHNWIAGKAFVFHPLHTKPLAGMYELTIDNTVFTLRVKGQPAKEQMNIMVDTMMTGFKIEHKLDGDLISFSIVFDGKTYERFSGIVKDKEWSGEGLDHKGDWVKWSARYIGPLPENQKDKTEKNSPDEDNDKTEQDERTGQVIYPFLAFGWEKKPKQETFLFKNATVWTNEKEGILSNTDVLVQNGKVKQIAKDIAVSGAIEIDATGKHLTCGIIDEHSHIAISRGVNECTQSSTAEVRIGDVINSEDINIYRQLSGGVTTSQLLHGSCNPIGGQSALIKLRWGYAPEAMKFENADPFIKFALGENVKRTRVPNNNRFPHTRMGVEQVYADAFTRAKAYQKKKQTGDAAFRKDLDLEALSEILKGKRFITCHSYVQSEINMLMHIADKMGFKVNTFTHILEGYKIAKQMKKHGAGASTFSDWWAYKYEVIDAIPYNAALLNEAGIVTAINSDDAEMARRLNQEAAKAVMYGNVSEEEAWKMVTLNPAKLLHIDHRVGSVKEGKDADLVLWSDNPLSIYAKAEMTLVDGIRFFDRQEDITLRKQVAAERHRLIQKMLSEKKNGADTQKPSPHKPKHYHCDDAEDEMVD